MDTFESAAPSALDIGQFSSESEGLEQDIVLYLLPLSYYSIEGNLPLNQVVNTVRRILIICQTFLLVVKLEQWIVIRSWRVLLRRGVIERGCRVDVGTAYAEWEGGKKVQEVVARRPSRMICKAPQ